MSDDPILMDGVGTWETSQAGHILDQIFSSGHPADRVLDRFFREHRLGPGERGRIGTMVYQVLRHRDFLSAQLNHHFPRSTHGCAALAAMAVVSIRRDGNKDPGPWPGILATEPESNTPFQDDFPADTLPSWQRHSLPRWIWDIWMARHGHEETQALVQALNSPAPVDLRLDLRRMTREELLSRLAVQGIKGEPLPFSPDGLRLHGRPSVTSLPEFGQGLLEIQDEGSQLIGHVVGVRPGMTVVDFCAGAGGKSLHLAVLMNDRGRIWATDSDPSRLNRMKPRLKRWRLKSIRPLALRHEGDPALKKLQGSADRVLVDAPCSASGTLRRNPEIKWRLTPELLENFHLRQCAILQAAARLTAPQGRLVYATCSLMPRENEDVVEEFLFENKNFRLLPHSTISMPESLRGLLPPSPFLILLPHRTRTDGFFAAILERTY
ncbi:MAG: RsmB/NOP family class I SAM-dependent RNA methyltransferase [Magnetococcales bacterium]|nr:RsmB/NOP family class I SAM-dependent RNA methyltransferase [Magnetococcales bacterium]